MADENKEQKTNDGKVTKDSPMFKFESDGSLNMTMIWLTCGAVAIVVACYVAGVMTGNSMLSGAAFLLAIVFAAVIYAMNRQINKSRYQLTEEQIDEKVEQYKADLIDTFTGYDVQYTTHDIISAADHYREQLEQENVSFADFDPKNAASIFKAMIADGKAARKSKKESKAMLKESQRNDKIRLGNAKKK